MALGDINDLFARLKAQIPGSWFKLSPNFDATLQGPAWALSSIYAQITYAALQTRIATATDGYLDLIANDFFGTSLPRLTNEADGAYRVRILANLFVKGPTRANMSAVLKLITGRTPDIFEPSNTTDSGGWGGPSTDNVNPTGTPSIYRTDWQGTQLLYAAARTNQFRNSVNLASASWSNSRVGTITATTGPDGSSNAYTLTANATGGTYLYQSMSVVAGQQYPISVFAYAGSVSSVSLQSFTQSGIATFTLTGAGTAGVPSGVMSNARITALGGGWYLCSALLTPTSTASDNVAAISFNAGVVGDTATFFGPLFGAAGDPVGSYIPNATTAAATLTDYTLSPSGLVTLASTPAQGAALTWSGTGTDAVTGAPVAANNQFFGSGNGYQSAFQLVMPTIVDSGFYWDTGVGKWGAPMPYQSYVTAYRPITNAQSLGELDSWRWSWDSYGAWSDAPVTAVTDAAIIAAVESTRMTATIVWLRIENNPVTP